MSVSNNKHIGDSQSRMCFENDTAEAHALLALVYEQRTANLLTYLALAGNSETASIPVPVTKLVEVQGIVEERLDLE